MLGLDAIPESQRYELSECRTETMTLKDVIARDVPEANARALMRAWKTIPDITNELKLRSINRFLEERMLNVHVRGRKIRQGRKQYV